MGKLHDGDTYLLRGGESPLFAEVLDTDGRIAIRLTDRFGGGILLEAPCMAALSVIIDTMLEKPAPDCLEYFKSI
jgi:hypothetical protein